MYNLLELTRLGACMVTTKSHEYMLNKKRDDDLSDMLYLAMYVHEGLNFILL